MISLDHLVELTKDDLSKQSIAPQELALISGTGDRYQYTPAFIVGVKTTKLDGDHTTRELVYGTTITADSRKVTRAGMSSIGVELLTHYEPIQTDLSSL